jgi:type I restriction enzyme S subunit
LDGNERTLGDLAVQVIDHIDPSEMPQTLFHHYSLPNYDAGRRPQLEFGMSIKSGKLKVTDGTVLLSKLNPGNPKVWRIPTAMGQHAIASTEFLVLKPRTGITLNALYAACLNPSFLRSVTAKATGTSSSHQRVRPSDLLATNLHLHVGNADLAEIGNFIAALDDKIELNRRMNTTLEAMARALFQSWFVDFDPVRAKAEGRQPVGMDAETAALFPDSFEGSVLGPIPKGWVMTTVNQLFSLKNNRVEPGPNKNHLRYVALDNMKSKSIGIDSFRAGSEVNSSIIEFAQGDILFGSMRPYFHKVGLAPFDGITRTTTFVLAPKAEWLRHFGLFQLSTDVAIEYATSASIGTTIPYVTWDALGQYKCISPPEEILKAFSKEAGDLVAQMNVNISTASTLAELRDAQLTKLLSGELRVGDSTA